MEMNRFLVLAAAWVLAGCSRHTAAPVSLSGDVSGSSTVWLGDAGALTLQSQAFAMSTCGDITVFDRGGTVARWDGGMCDPCVRGCTDIEQDRRTSWQDFDASATVERIQQCASGCKGNDICLQLGGTVVAQATESGAIYAGNVTPSSTNWSAMFKDRTLRFKTQAPRDGGRGEEYAFDGTDGNVCVQACKDGLVSEWADSGERGSDASVHHAVACVQRCGFTLRKP